MPTAKSRNSASSLARAAVSHGASAGRSRSRARRRARRYRAVLADHPLVLVEGTIQQADGATSMLVRSIAPFAGTPR
jgi:hypothetical protein